MFSSVVTESDISYGININGNVNISSDICLKNRCDKPRRRFSFFEKLVKKDLHSTFTSNFFTIIYSYMA